MTGVPTRPSNGEGSTADGPGWIFVQPELTIKGSQRPLRFFRDPNGASRDDFSLPAPRVRSRTCKRPPHPRSHPGGEARLGSPQAVDDVSQFGDAHLHDAAHPSHAQHGVEPPHPSLRGEEAVRVQLRECSREHGRAIAFCRHRLAHPSGWPLDHLPLGDQLIVHLRIGIGWIVDGTLG